MDTQLVGAHGTLRACIASIGALALLATMGATSAWAASPSVCSVTNTDSGRAYRRLQTAVDAAKPGDRLVVKGTCHGGTVIDKDLVIEGVQTSTSGKAILDGDHRTRVLLVEKGVKVSLQSLIIRDGNARARHWDYGRRLCLDGDVSCGRMGGGIDNKGHLTLRDVVVRDNVAGQAGGGINNGGILTLNGNSRVTGNSAGRWGGGIHNGGTKAQRFPTRTARVTINGTSSIANNSALSGGGVSNFGILTLNGSSGVTGNTADGIGGGVGNAGTCTLNGSSHISGNHADTSGGADNDGGNRAILTLNDRSSITDNTAEAIGGVKNQGSLTLNDASSISANTARVGAGGVSNSGRFTMHDDSQVSANTARGHGGGVVNGGTLTMKGRTRISGNTVLFWDGPLPGGPYDWGGVGGGLYNFAAQDYGEVHLQDESSITGNVAEGGGGGVAFQGGTAADNAFVCAPSEGANVHGNTPDDCLSIAFP